MAESEQFSPNNRKRVMAEGAKQATGGTRERKGSGRIRGQHHSALLKDGPAPPDRIAYEEKNKQLTSQIEEREKQIKHTPTDNADLSAQMRSKGEEYDSAEAERNRVSQEVRKVEQSIKRLGEEVAKEKETANRQAVELRFRNEASYDQLIAKHQRQLENGNFLSPDDKIKRKLETEIENLKHCKVRLRDYLAAKSRIDSKVNEQDALRKKRDFLYGESKKLKDKIVRLRDAQEELRQKLEDRKGKQKEFQAQQAELRREIDDLYKQRKELRDSFSQEQAQHSELMRKARQARIDEQREAARQKDLERKVAREVWKKEKEAEKEMKREQEYDVERGTCRALINYLKNLTPASVESSAEGTPEGASAGAVQTSPPTKRAEEEWVPSGGRRKSKRDKKKSSTKVQHRHLQLNQTTLYQFLQLRMTPPFNVSQIPTVLEELNAKLRMYEAMIRAQSEAGDSGIGLFEPANGEQTPTRSAGNDKSDSSITPSPCSSPMLGKSSPNTSEPQVEPSTPPQTITQEIKSNPSTTTVSS